MPDDATILLFCEDRAQRAFLEPLIRRIAAKASCSTEIRCVSARGGHPRAIGEFANFQKNEDAHGAADLVIVAIDGNCATFAKKREEIRKVATRIATDRLITATPDPHIERWFLADPENAMRVIGAMTSLPEDKCERSVYKATLQDTIRSAGHGGSVDGIAFAEELAARMDIHRAGRIDHSLRSFVDELRGWFQRRTDR